MKRVLVLFIFVVGGFMAGLVLACLPPQDPKLTISASPKDAHVSILNISTRYRIGGMVLKPGLYDVLVEKEGYQAKRQWIRLGPVPIIVSVKLDQLAEGEQSKPVHDSKEKVSVKSSIKLTEVSAR